MKYFLFLLMLSKFAMAEDAASHSARSPEVLNSYKIGEGVFEEAISALPPKLRRFCATLLGSQLRLQRETDSWKLYSLYEALEKESLMTAALVRVPTVTELRSSLPKYTNYRAVKFPRELQDGMIVISGKGAACGPDPLAPAKGSYFLKCGAYLIGSGLMLARDYEAERCPEVRVLENAGLK